MRTNAMSAEKLEAMKGRMAEAGWEEVNYIADEVLDCEDGADVADVLIHRLDISTGDIEDWREAWELVCEWADGSFTAPAPF